MVGVAEEERTDAGGQWKYVPEDGGATITGYVGEYPTGYIEDNPHGYLALPAELDGHRVTGIGAYAFHSDDAMITSIAIPDSVTRIDGAFDSNDLILVFTSYKETDPFGDAQIIF